MDDNARVSGLILVGGHSARMGENKALLEVGEITLIERVIGVLEPLCDEILLVSSNHQPYQHLGYPLVSDAQPGYGPLMGLYSGLRAANSELCLLVACDMPFLDTSLLRFMVAKSAGVDVVIPRTDDGLHPLCAVYRRRSCLPAINASLARHQRRMIAFHETVVVREITAMDTTVLASNGDALLNVNTPDDLAYARDAVSGNRSDVSHSER